MPAVCHDAGQAPRNVCYCGVIFLRYSDTLESFLSKVAFESNLREKLSRIERVLIVKVSFERRKIAKVFMTHVQVFFRRSLSKATFERKLSSVSLALVRAIIRTF